MISPDYAMLKIKSQKGKLQKLVKVMFDLAIYDDKNYAFYIEVESTGRLGTTVK